MRATKGKAAITSGTMVALGPMVVPTMSLVRGMIAMSRIRNGMERMMFTITSRTLYRTGWGAMPSFALVTRRTPRGSPIT